MLILALDTTTRGGSAAVLDNDDVRAVVPGDRSRTHAERLPGELADALRQAGVAASAIELLAVAAGPGGFTGLRIGLAAMQGLALTLAVPVVGVSALDALAQTAAQPPGLHAAARGLVGSWIDAQRGEVFGALYRARRADSGELPWEEIRPPSALSPDQTLDAWSTAITGPITFIGDGATRYLADGTGLPAGHELWRGPTDLAPAIGRIGRRLAARGLAGPPHQLRPLYVRRADVEIERARRSPS